MQKFVDILIPPDNGKGGFLTPKQRQILDAYNEIMRSTKPSKRRGKRGGPQHEAKVNKIQQLREDQKCKHEAGGTLPEMKVQTPDGGRYPDLIHKRKNGELIYDQIGKKDPKRGYSKRELDNLKSLEGTGVETHLHDYLNSD